MMVPAIFKDIYLGLAKGSKMNTQLQYQFIAWHTVSICVCRKLLGVLPALNKVLILLWM